MNFEVNGALIVSLITAVGLFLKVIFDNRNAGMGAKGGYLESLVKNIKSLSEQNLDLQQQIDDKQKQIDELKEEMENILAGKYQIVLNITAGKKFSIDNAAMKILEEV